MLSDFHMHTEFSGDCEAPVTDMIEKAISLGMPAMCITDHFDLDFPETPDMFLLDFDEYFKVLEPLKEKYKNQIQLRIGIELGLQPHITKELKEIVEKYPFDFIIGSSHVLDKADPYYPAFWENKEEKDVYSHYFKSIEENIESFSDFDVYGHIDYIVRYGPNKNKYYSYEAYRDELDAALRKCIENGIGLELNTGGFAYKLGHPNPHPDVIKRYRELGGEIITVGADAHSPKRIAYEFKQAAEILKECGFNHYTIFKERKPEFVKL